MKRLGPEKTCVPSTPNGDRTVGVPTANEAGVLVGGSGNGKSNGKVVEPSKGSVAAGGSLRRALVLSIDAAIAAERYASEKGLSIQFGSEYLRAMAVSLFIQHARD